MSRERFSHINSGQVLSPKDARKIDSLSKRIRIPAKSLGLYASPLPLLLDLANPNQTDPTCPYRNPQGKVAMVREVRVNGDDAVCEGRKDVGSYRVGVYRLGIHTGVVVYDVKTGASSDIRVPVIGPTIVGLDNGSTVTVGPGCIAGLPLNDCNIMGVTNPPSQPPAQSSPKLAPTSRPVGIPTMSPSGNPTAIPTVLPQTETRPPGLNLPDPLANVPPLVSIPCGTLLLASLGVAALASFSTRK